MNSQMFRLNAVDIGRGVIIAALAAILSALAQAMNLPGFDFSTFNWTQLLTVGMTAGIGYIVKNYLSDQSGAFLGHV